MNSKILSRSPVRAPLHSLTAAFLATLLALPAHAATDLPDVPPTLGAGVAPNILFILDDSGSMSVSGGQYMDVPNFEIEGSGDVDKSDGDVNWYDEDDDFQRVSGDDGDRRRDINKFSYTNNSLYYDPHTTYRPWMKADGSYMDNASYTASWIDLDTQTQPYDLSERDRAFHVPKKSDVDKTKAANYYRYRFKEGSGADQCEWIYDGDEYRWGNCSGVTSFTWTVKNDDGTTSTITRTLAQEKANFANWHSYHRTRMKAAKAGAGYAFAELGERYRIGYASIHNRNPYPIPVDNDDGLFRDTNRSTWFTHLYAAAGNSGTPLHTALYRAGEYFKSDAPYGGDKGSDGKPFQCRRNFAILTTDGYWNEGAGDTGIGNADATNGPTIRSPKQSDGSYEHEFTYEAKAPYSGGDSTTLADVAMHYWKNDLRPDMDNIIQAASFWQNMTTFGISIGLQGTVDQTSVEQVLSDGGVSRGGSKLADWPNPMNDEDNERIDDLLHAAVNGHGEFIAATDPGAFAKGLRKALGDIAAQTTSRSSVAASSTSISTDTRLFQAQYLGGDWRGEVMAFPVSQTGVNEEAPIWKASEEFPSWDKRDIFTTDAAGSKGQFPTAAQTTALGTATKDDKAFSIAEYIKGNAAGEQRNGGPLRSRLHLLGDIIHSSPHYVEETRTLYVGANDGMLHAFDDSDDGREEFAYIPRGIAMADLKELSSPSYSHKYFVDGPVVVSDRETTITATYPQGRYLLAGTLGHGGKGVYALDVTAPASFGTSKILFDLTGNTGDADMGLVLGHPFIATMNDGSTSVVFGNGINSTNESAVLYIVNVDTGAVTRIDTGYKGNNGLSAPVGWDNDGNGTVDLVYAGDQQGNLWKFDLSGDNSKGKSKAWSVALGGTPLMVATDVDGKRQPINGRPAIGIDPVLYRRWVFFGSGRLLTNADVTDKSVQTMYGIIDGEAIGARSANDGASGSLVQRTFESAGSIDGKPVRSFQDNEGGLATGKRGWFVDLVMPPDSLAEGERIVGAAQVVGPVLLTSSIIPDDDPCGSNGRGYINAIDAFSGTSVSDHFFDIDLDGDYTDDQVGDNPVGSVDTNVGMNTDAVLIDKILAVGGSGGSGGMTGSAGANSGAASGRISWRENIGE